MRFSLIALFFALSSLAQASEGRVRVACRALPFVDLKKIEIRETDLDGQYQIVETGVDATRLSPTFGVAEIEKSEFPALADWNGYARRLVRYGRGNYAIEVRDECGGAVSGIDCRESF